MTIFRTIPGFLLSITYFIHINLNQKQFNNRLNFNILSVGTRYPAVTSGIDGTQLRFEIGHYVTVNLAQWSKILRFQ